jgi:hypothetical protein
VAIEATCSQCKFRRVFAPELSGRFYRCPKCREGVIAVPHTTDDEMSAWETSQDAWEAEESASFEAVRADEASADEASADEASEDEDSLGDDSNADSESNRGQVATARKILVECGLCHFHINVPPAFFGKTVHCPNCAGDTMFSESTLEPVKDEILDRLIMETSERRALFPTEPGPLSWTAVRSFVVGVALGLVVLAVYLLTRG